jgi:hypothetical protein
MDNKSIALPSFPEVKSCSVPLTASHMSDKSFFTRLFLEPVCEDITPEVYVDLLMSFSFKMLTPQFLSGDI